MTTIEDPSPHMPLFLLAGRPLTYTALVANMRTLLAESGMAAQDLRLYGGHSFRVGGAQALAMAGRSTPYIMALGRWRLV